MAASHEAKALLDFLLSEPQGEIVGWNIIHAIEMNFLVEDRVKATMHAVLKQFLKDPPIDIEQFKTILATEWSELLFEGPTTTSRVSSRETLTNITKYIYFLYLFDEDLAVKAGITLPDPEKYAAGSLQIRSLEELNGYPMGILQESAMLGHRVLWLTPDSPLTCTADTARDVLGLIHHSSGVDLISITLSDADIKALGCRRPTFADAGTHRRFRQKPSEHSESDMGRAVDLAQHKSQPVENAANGLLEIVTRPQMLKSLRPTWKYLGRTERDGETAPDERMTSRDYDKKFADRLCGKSSEDLRIMLESLF